MSHPLWTVAALSLVLFFSSQPARGAEPAGDYDSLISAARAFAAEGSHALAQQKFSDALALAKNDEQKRWTQLWVLTEAAAADRSHGRVPQLHPQLRSE